MNDAKASLSNVRRTQFTVAPSPSMPLDDAEAAALYLLEHMPPAMRVDLGQRLIAGAARERAELRANLVSERSRSRAPMDCDGKTLYLDERFIESYDIDEAWLAMTSGTKTAYTEVVEALEEAGQTTCDGKTLEYRIMAGLIIPEAVLHWLAMTLPTRKTWNAAIERLNPELDC